MKGLDSIRDALPSLSGFALLAAMAASCSDTEVQEKNAFDALAGGQNGNPVDVVNPAEDVSDADSFGVVEKSQSGNPVEVAKGTPSFEEILGKIECKTEFKLGDENITDAQLLQILKCQEISKVSFNVSSGGEIFELIIALKNEEEVRVKVLASMGKDIQQYLMGKGVDTGVVKKSAIDFSSIFGDILFFVFLFIILKKFLPGIFPKPRQFFPINYSPKIRFDDIAGLGHVKEDLRMLVYELRNREQICELGGVIPRGVLFTGPPGSGKTLAASAVATEAGAPFIEVSASEMVSKWVGDTSKNLRALFEKAKAVAKEKGSCVIFIDELDSIGAKRTDDEHSTSRERNSIVNQLLSSMDGFDKEDHGVIVIAATNFPESLDSALLRTGRFDRKLEFSYPNQDGRLELLKIATDGLTLADDVRLEAVASTLVERSGADIDGVVREAHLFSIRRGDGVIKQADFITAIDRIILGIESDRVLSELERRRCAYHEAGHTVVALSDPDTTVERVTIRPRGMSLGATLTPPLADRHILSKAQLEWQIRVFLAGKIAEMMHFQDGSTGAAGDLCKGTELATKMVVELGLAPDGIEGLCAYRRYSPDVSPLFYADHPAVEHAIDRVLDDCAGDVTAILGRKEGLLKAIADRLIATGSIDHDEIMRLMVMFGQEGEEE